jgi:hypothetical protein
MSMRDEIARADCRAMDRALVAAALCVVAIAAALW